MHLCFIASNSKQYLSWYIANIANGSDPVVGCQNDDGDAGLDNNGEKQETSLRGIPAVEYPKFLFSLFKTIAKIWENLFGPGDPSII